MKIKNKLIWVYVGAILLPIVILFCGLIFSLIQETQVREAIAKDAAYQRVTTNVYGLFEDMNQIGIYFSADTDIYSTLTNYDPSDYFDVLNTSRIIDNRISIIHWAFPRVRSITLYHNSEELINRDQLKYLDEQSLNADWYKNYIKSDEDFYFSSDFYNEEMYILMTNSLSSYFSQGNILIHQELGQEEIVLELQDGYFYDKSTVFLLNDRNQIIAASNDLYTSGNQIQVFDETMIKDISKLQYFQFNYKNHTNGWQLVYYVDQPGFVRNFSNSLTFLIIVLIIIFIGSFILIQVVSNSISKRLNSVSSVMEISQEGTLIKAKEDHSSDEIGIVIQSYNRMVLRLEKLLYEINVSKDTAHMLLQEKTAAYDELESANEELASVNTELTNSFEEIRNQNIKINKLIYEDKLTGLINRLAITNIIDDCLLTSNSQYQVVIFLDIDNFKFINDTYGHDTGDLVICATSNILKQFNSDDITIGRFGGDEFLIFINNISDKMEVVGILELMISTFIDPIVVENKKFYLTCSIGVSISPDHGVTRSELIKKADMALYRSKNTGKNKYTFYDADIENELEEKTILQLAVKDAAINDEFYLNFQPYVNTHTGKLVGFEALIRWFSPKLGQVSPFKLIKIAEEIGLIISVGDWVIEQSLLFIKDINYERTEKLVVSINISVVQLLSKDFIERLVGITKTIGVTPAEICLEMTETVLIDSFIRSRNRLHSLMKLGFGIALDDFGTGYSSLSYFNELPVTVLKIDKSFIDELSTSSFSKELVTVIITIAHSKGIKVTAEGVETLEQLEILTALNCDIIQGFYFSKPLSHEDAANY